MIYNPCDVITVISFELCTVCNKAYLNVMDACRGIKCDKNGIRIPQKKLWHKFVIRMSTCMNYWKILKKLSTYCNAVDVLAAPALQFRLEAFDGSFLDFPPQYFPRCALWYLLD